MAVRLSIVIVTYNSRPYLEQCLKAVFRERNTLSLEVILVDNHSSDRGTEDLSTRFSPLSVIRNGANAGFARACNQGLERAHGTYVLFLNPDTVVSEDALIKCVRYMDANEAVGILGCRLRHPEGVVQPSCSDFPFVEKLFLDHLLRIRLFSPALRQKRLLKYWRHNEIREVDWILGAFMLSRRRLLNTLNGFDEDFFLYGEDMDLCYRIRQYGYKTVYFPHAETLHVGNPVWNRERIIRVHQAMLMFYRKHFSLPAVLLLRLMLQVEIVSRWPRCA